MGPCAHPIGEHGPGSAGGSDVGVVADTTSTIPPPSSAGATRCTCDSGVLPRCGPGVAPPSPAEASATGSPSSPGASPAPSSSCRWAAWKALGRRYRRTGTSSTMATGKDSAAGVLVTTKMTSRKTSWMHVNLTISWNGMAM